MNLRNNIENIIRNHYPFDDAKSVNELVASLLEAFEKHEEEQEKIREKASHPFHMMKVGVRTKVILMDEITSGHRTGQVECPLCEGGNIPKGLDFTIPQHKTDCPRLKFEQEHPLNARPA